MGQPVPVASGRSTCSMHALETARSGQVRIGVPAGARRPYATGVQTPCVACAAAGVDRLGMPDRDPEHPEPLCLSCWRGRVERRDAGERRRLVAELREDLADVVDVDDGCGACGSLAPVADCWLCGWSWMAQQRVEFERDQAAAAAEAEARFARIAAVTEAEARVQELTGWVERLRAVVAAYEPGGPGERRVELLADLLARVDAARSSDRGRPGMLPRVGAVLAMSSDPRSGRYAMPGRDRTVDLVGCRRRATVSDAWARMEALDWCVRTRQGRRLTLQERRELGRWNDRAEFDLTMLHRSPFDRAAFVPAALATFAELLDVADGLLVDAFAELDAARAEAESWTEAPEFAHRAKLRRAVARSADQALNIRTPSSGTQGEYLSSCLIWGLKNCPSIMLPVNRGPAAGGEEGQIGASRSSTGAGAKDLGRVGGCSPRLARPRTAKGEKRASRPPKPRPEWADWAYELARALRKRWWWLRKVRLSWVASTLGAALGPDWTADQVVEYVMARRGGRPLLVDPDRPVAYLRKLLDQALTADVEPPQEARRTVEHRRAMATTQGVDLRIRRDGARAAWTEQTSRAVPGHANAAVQALRARWAAEAAPADVEDWPEVAQPGSGPAGPALG